MVPVYILGLLLRFGPQHGYQIKKLVSEYLSDFTQIKLSLIYFHLEKMHKDGLLQAVQDKNTNRPKKTV
jgi:DNA-binding PadR family transcriptional regulator